MDVIGGIGYALDTPGAYTRGLLANRPGERVSGRDLVAPMFGENRPGFDAGDIPGFLADILVDPLNLIPFGALLKGGRKLAKVARAAGPRYPIPKGGQKWQGLVPPKSTLLDAGTEADVFLTPNKRVIRVPEYLSRSMYESPGVARGGGSEVAEQAARRRAIVGYAGTPSPSPSPASPSALSFGAPSDPAIPSDVARAMFESPGAARTAMEQLPVSSSQAAREALVRQFAQASSPGRGPIPMAGIELRRKMLRDKKRTGVKGGTEVTGRPRSPDIIQPSQAVHIGGDVVENLPFVQTGGDLVDRVTMQRLARAGYGETPPLRAGGLPQEMLSKGTEEQAKKVAQLLQRRLAKQGVKWSDPHIGNLAVQGSHAKLLDPGYLQVAGDSPFPRAMVPELQDPGMASRLGDLLGYRGMVRNEWEHLPSRDPTFLNAILGTLGMYSAPKSAMSRWTQPRSEIE